MLPEGFAYEAQDFESVGLGRERGTGAGAVLNWEQLGHNKGMGQFVNAGRSSSEEHRLWSVEHVAFGSIGGLVMFQDPGGK